MSLRDTARVLVKTADRLAVLCEKYLVEAQADARESGRDNTAGGMGPVQLRRLLQAHVVARISPRPLFGMPDPPIKIDGAPEARKFAAAHSLPGLGK